MENIHHGLHYRSCKIFNFKLKYEMSVKGRRVAGRSSSTNLEVPKLSTLAYIHQYNLIMKPQLYIRKMFKRTQ